MGITQSSLERIDRAKIKFPGSILILGCQNLYNVNQYGQLAKDHFHALGYVVNSWDITGCQGSNVVDLREQQTGQYDTIFQHGTLEHLDRDLYTGFKNCHDLLKVGGIVIHENPKTGNWPGHGTYYFTTHFYEMLAIQNGYEILELTEEPAMGNVIDGWNVCCVLRKLHTTKFMGKKAFNELDFRNE